MPATTHRLLCWFGSSALACFALAGGALAQPQDFLHTGHALPGFYGFESSVRPDMGMSYENLVYMYNATQETDRGGHDTGTSGSVHHLSDHFSAAWTSPWKIFGGNYVARVTASIGNSAPNPRSLASENSGLRLGDSYLEPLALYWTSKKVHASFRAGLWLDTADFDANSNKNAGKGFNTYQLALGFTCYPYEDRLLHFSMLARLGLHSKVEDLDLHPGDDLVIDWSLGKHLTDRWNAGLVGYGVWQTSRDRGADANADLGFYGTASLGLGGRYEIPSWGGHAELRAYHEFNSYNHTEGQVIAFGVNFKL